MVNKCSVIGCNTNYKGHETGAVFKLPKEKDLQEQWVKFLYRQDYPSLKKVFICYKHFSENFLDKNGKRLRLKKELNPVPTIIPETQKKVNPPSAIVDSIIKPRKAPKFRPFQEDELEKFKKMDRIEKLDDINECMVKYLGNGFILEKHDTFVIIYKLERNPSMVPEVTHCIKIDEELRVKLFYKSIPVPLPIWFRKGRNTKLTSKGMLQNFISYMNQEAESHMGVLEELNNLKFYKNPIYSANLIRFALKLRYTSLPAYKLLCKEFTLPSVSHLRQLTRGKYFSKDFVLLMDD